MSALAREQRAHRNLELTKTIIESAVSIEEDWMTVIEDETLADETFDLTIADIARQIAALGAIIQKRTDRWLVNRQEASAI